MARVMAKSGANNEVASRFRAWALDVAERLDLSGQLVFDPANRA
jgi:hypothetical protein